MHHRTQPGPAASQESTGRPLHASASTRSYPLRGQSELAVHAFAAFNRGLLSSVGNNLQRAQAQAIERSQSQYLRRAGAARESEAISSMPSPGMQRRGRKQLESAFEQAGMMAMDRVDSQTQHGSGLLPLVPGGPSLPLLAGPAAFAPPTTLTPRAHEVLDLTHVHNLPFPPVPVSTTLTTMADIVSGRRGIGEVEARRGSGGVPRRSVPSTGNPRAAQYAMAAYGHTALEYQRRVQAEYSVLTRQAAAAQALARTSAPPHAIGLGMIAMPAESGSVMGENAGPGGTAAAMLAITGPGGTMGQVEEEVSHAGCSVAEESRFDRAGPMDSVD
jgi:hypothetical protein